MGLTRGMVLAVFGSSYSVRIGTRTVSCALRGKFRKLLKEAHNPIAVGDRVRFETLPDGTGVIEELLPRRNTMSRPTRWGPSREKIIAANVDRVVAVVSAKQPPLKTGVIDRILIVTGWEKIPTTICINKSDLAAPGELDEIAAVYRKLRYAAFCVSAETGDGIPAFRDSLTGRFSVFMGQSGVGKTSLLNRLQPGLGRRIREVSEATDKGKHTTSHVSAVLTDFGATVVDTPGFRQFGLWGVERDDIDVMFREFRRHIDACRFRPCSHMHEPGCAVRAAVDSGKIAAFRYENYRKIYDSFDEKVDPFN